jgi:hypothetical protein
MRRRLSRRRGGAGLGWMFVPLLGVLGCGTAQPPPVDFSTRARDYGPRDYPVVYERWTRHGKVLQDIDSALEVWATYKSRDYREAFVARYGDVYSLSAADRESLRHAQREAAVASYEFVVTAQSANFRWNDLEKKSSPWRVTMLDDSGHALVPEGVKVEKLPDLFEREFFPVKTPFTKTYTIRFPRAAGKDTDFTGERDGHIILRFAGPLGHADLEWSTQ